MDKTNTGLISGITAYALWGLFPLYFVLFARSGAFEVVAYRALWSLVFCLLLLAVTRSLGQLRAILRDRRSALVLGVAGLLIAINWTTYVYGVATGRTLDAALGYFINPLAVTLLGVLVLGERLRRAQWIALAFGAAAVVVLVVAYGEFPFIAITLALSFGTYSLVKKLAGRSVAPTPGLAMETAAVAPIALGYLIYLGVTAGGTVDLLSGYGLLMATTGVVTAIPLILFADAARKVSLVTIGMLQYLAPIGQFLVGWLAFGEPMPAARWAGFALVWVAVLIFAVDAVLLARRRRLV
ncbi:EamA family transporter RarD [Tessaracoccus lacteus]|uniref:EamA family transporter RarD n=1 Tax=Tessaracoccus lacteus TaxID=3041766 RepID=A0ABY8Q005_9ACTN|nr:EamA family transporter RarD [Tessaracoccus sp. T21]WGT48111.1 EamA family transporter RarD [Tessaracoccus sp. T21]